MLILLSTHGQEKQWWGRSPHEEACTLVLLPVCRERLGKGVTSPSPCHSLPCCCSTRKKFQAMGLEVKRTGLLEAASPRRGFSI